MLREAAGWAAPTPSASVSVASGGRAALEIVGFGLVEAGIAWLAACHDPLGVL